MYEVLNDILVATGILAWLAALAMSMMFANGSIELHRYTEEDTDADETRK